MPCEPEPPPPPVPPVVRTIQPIKRSAIAGMSVARVSDPAAPACAVPEKRTGKTWGYKVARVAFGPLATLAAIMTILVIYSLGSVDLANPPHGAPELAASLLTVLTHLLWRQALLSIFAGTASYMYLLQSGVL